VLFYFIGIYRKIKENLKENMLKKSFLIAILVTLLSLTNSAAFAQIPAALTGGETKPAEATPTVDILGRQTPKGLVEGFLQAVKNENYQKAAMFLDLEKFPESERSEKGKELSLGLQNILDQSGTVISSSRLSTDPNGDQNDGLSIDTEIVGTMKINGEKIDIFAQKFQDPTYGGIWKISYKTVDFIPAALKKLSTGYLDRILPHVLIDNKIYGVPVGHWIAIFTLAISSLLLSLLLSYIVIILIRFFWKSTSSGFAKHILDAFIWPIRLYIAVAMFAISTNIAGISIIARQHFSVISTIIAWFSIAWIFWSVIELVTETTKIRLLREKKRSALSAVVFFRRTARTILAVIVISIALKNMGLDITAGLTALGIGGLALAFGAQKTLENFMASLNIIVEQPLRIGDFCKIGDVVGTVQDIGMRSTRIQTLYRSMVTIPNGQLATQTIENYAHRDRFLFKHEIGLRYETTPDQMRWIMLKMREILYSHPCIDSESVRVRLNSFAASSLNLDLFAYIYAEEYNEYMEVQEDILLRFMDVIAEGGSSFAFPSQTIYMGKDDGLPKNKQTAAEDATKKMRAEAPLKLYRFDEAQINEMANSLEYPPLSNNSDVSYF